MPPTNDQIRSAFAQWFSSLQTYKTTYGLPARGSVAAALVVLEHLKENYVLDLASHQAGGRAQLRGLNPSSVQAILARFGETRQFVGEGGRTNRGGPGDVQRLLEALRPLKLESESATIRNSTLDEFQRLLVEKVQEYHGRKRLEISYNASVTTWAAVREILDQARQVAKAGPVAQYLVGAKLQLRFPKVVIANDRYSAADVQTGRHGDFQVQDTTFHVTVSPAQPVYEKCLQNIRDGLRVYLLVPDSCLVGARQNAQTASPDRIAVESIESFVANNIEELSQFASNDLAGGFRRLLEKYNERVDAIELDKSLLIEIPPSLA
jgi:hypothetical protein